jgi:branched-chain amino acid transport system substrate-binding protein
MWNSPIVKALSAAFILASSTSTLAADELIIKIGHAGPLSGTVSHIGKDNENGARLAIEELNARGININGKPAKFVLVAEDDGADPKQGTAVAHKLVDAKVSGVAGHYNSSTSIPASKIYFDAGIPQIATSSSTDYNPRGIYNSAFRIEANDGKLGGALGRYAVDTLNAKTVTVIDDRTAYGQGLADNFIKGLKSKNPKIKMTQRQYTNNKATDFNAILTSIKSAKPDVIFFGGMDTVAGPMLRQMKALGIKAKFIGGDGVCTAKLLELAGDALGEEQVICAVPGGVEAAGQKNLDDFYAKYKKRFGIPVQHFSPFVYDSVMVLAEAMQQAKSSDPAVYLPVLRKIHHKGITGEISFDDKGEIQNGTVTLYKYQPGKRLSFAVLKV